MQNKDYIFKIGTDTEHYIKIKEKAFIEEELKYDTDYELKGVVTTNGEMESQKNGQILTYKAEFTSHIELKELGTASVIKGRGKGSYSQRFHGRLCGYAKDELGEIDLEAFYENFMKKAIRYVPELCEYLSTKS